MRGRSLQARLLVGLTGLFVGLSLVAAVLVVVLDRPNSRRDLETRLHGEAHALVGYYAATQRVDFPGLENPEGFLGLRLLQGSKVLAQSPQLPELAVLTTPPTETLESLPGPGGDLVVVRVPLAAGATTVAEAIAEPAYLAASARRLGAAAVFTPLLLLPLAAAGAWVLAGRWVTPLAHLLTAIRGIDSKSLSERLTPPPGAAVEIVALGDEVNALLERLEESVLGMRRFTADASHELRTPLAILRTSIEVALRRPRTAEEYEAVVRECLQEILRVQRTIEGLLTLARDAPEVGYGLTIVPLSFSELVRSVVSSADTLADAREVGIDTAIEPGLEVSGQADLLRLAVLNLVDNAIKYTPAGERVHVELRREGPQVCLAVTDRGPGIAPEDRPYIFERFYRGRHKAATAPKSGGLGLSVVRWVVESHQGQVGVADRADRAGPGTTFELRLPLGAQRPVPADPGAPASVAGPQ